MNGPTIERGVETGVWYCPRCGYVDAGTTDLQCSRGHRPTMYEEIKRGERITVTDSDQPTSAGDSGRTEEDQ